MKQITANLYKYGKFTNTITAKILKVIIAKSRVIKREINQMPIRSERNYSGFSKQKINKVLVSKI
jgi:hypothetical protein